MDKDRPNKIRIPGQKEQKINQKIITFMFFLALSFLLWLLNSLDHNYSSNISFHLKYIHHQPNKEMVGALPDELTLNVSGHGYTLLKSMLAVNSHPIILRVMSLNFIDTPDTSKFYVLTKNLKELVQRQIGSELTLNYIQPDTLFYTFSPVVRKKVAVEPYLEVDFEQQYMQGGKAIIIPDSVVISGPRAIIDTIKNIKTVSKKVSKANKSFTVELKLETMDRIYLEKKKVSVTVPVDKYTESSIMVPIRNINLPDSLELKVFPSAIKVTYIVSLKNYNLVNTRLFRALVDFRSSTNSINNKLKVTLDKQPSFIKSVSFYPKNVDYIVEK